MAKKKLPKAQLGISDPNEYKYRQAMYNDSLNLYNAYKMQDKLMGPGSYRVNNSGNQFTPAELKKARIKRYDPILNEWYATDYQSEQDQFKDGYDAWTARPEDQKLIKYYKSLGFTDDNIMYHSSPDLVHPKIKAIGTYHDGTARSPIYKKPVQPVYFDDTPRLKTLPLKPIETPQQELNLIPQTWEIKRTNKIIPPQSVKQWVQNPATGTWYQIERPQNPMFSPAYNPGTGSFQGGGEKNDYIETELDDNEIKDLIAQGYVVEELPKAQKGKEQKYNEYNQKVRYEQIYVPLVEKITNSDVVMNNWEKYPYYNTGRLEYILGGLDKNRNIPPATPEIKEMQQKILSLPNSELDRLMKVNWEGAGIPTLLWNKPSNVSTKEMWKYYNHLKYLKDKGYTLEEGGSIDLDLTDEEIEQYKAGGYIVEELPTAQEGLTTVPTEEEAYLASKSTKAIPYADKAIELPEVTVKGKKLKYAPLLQKDIPSETLNAVSQNYMGAKDLNQAIQRGDISRSVRNMKDPGWFYKTLTDDELKREYNRLSKKDKSTVNTWSKSSKNRAASTREFLISKEEQKIDALNHPKVFDPMTGQMVDSRTASARNNYNDGPIQMIYPEKYFIGPGAGLAGAGIRGLGRIASAEIPYLGGLTIGTAADIYGGIEGTKALVNAIEAQRAGDTEKRNEELFNAGLNIGLPAALHFGTPQLSKFLSNVSTAAETVDAVDNIKTTSKLKEPLSFSDIRMDELARGRRIHPEITGLGDKLRANSFYDPGNLKLTPGTEAHNAYENMRLWAAGVKGPEIPNVNRIPWRGIDKDDLRLYDPEELSRYGLTEMNFPFSNLRGETPLVEPGYMENLIAARDRAAKAGNESLAKVYDDLITKQKKDSLARFSERYTGEEALRTTKLNAFGDASSSSTLTDAQKAKGYDLKNNGNRIDLTHNNKPVGQIEQLNSKNPIVDSNGNKYNTINIEIDPSHRKKGLSKALYESMLEKMNDDGVDGIISIDNMLDSPEQSKAIRKYFDGEYTSDPEVLKRVHENIDSINEDIIADNKAWGDNEPLLEKPDKVYVLKPKKQVTKAGVIGDTDQFGNEITYDDSTSMQQAHETISKSIEDVRAKKIDQWKTAEGKKRLQNLIDTTPELKQAGVTPESYVEALVNMDNANKAYLDSLEKVNNLNDQLKALDQEYDNGLIGTKEYNDAIFDLEGRLEFAKRKMLGLRSNINSSSPHGAFIMQKDPWKTVDDKFIIAVGEANNPENLKQVIEHEITGHIAQRALVTSLDNELSKLDLKQDDLFSSLDDITVFKEKGFREFAKEPNYIGASKKYFETGSGGAEKLPYAVELRQDMLQKGTIAHDFDKITPEMIQKHYEAYLKEGANRQSMPVRILDIMTNKPSNFKLLADVLNKAPMLIPAIGAGIGAAQMQSGEEQ